MKRVHTHKRTKRIHRRNYKANRGGAWYDIFTGKTEQPTNQNTYMGEPSEQQQGLFSRFTGAFNKTRLNLKNKYIVQKYKAEQTAEQIKNQLTNLLPGKTKTNSNPNSNSSTQPITNGGSRRIRRTHHNRRSHKTTTKAKNVRKHKRVTRRHRH